MRWLWRFPVRCRPDDPSPSNFHLDPLIHLLLPSFLCLPLDLFLLNRPPRRKKENRVHAEENRKLILSKSRSRDLKKKKKEKRKNRKDDVYRVKVIDFRNSNFLSEFYKFANCCIHGYSDNSLLNIFSCTRRFDSFYQQCVRISGQ